MLRGFVFEISWFFIKLPHCKEGDTVSLYISGSPDYPWWETFSFNLSLSQPRIRVCWTQTVRWPPQTRDLSCHVRYHLSIAWWNKKNSTMITWNHVSLQGKNDAVGFQNVRFLSLPLSSIGPPLVSNVISLQHMEDLSNDCLTRDCHSVVQAEEQSRLLGITFSTRQQ